MQKLSFQNCLFAVYITFYNYIFNRYRFGKRNKSFIMKLYKNTGGTSGQNRFNHTLGVTAVISTDRPRSVRNRCIIKVFGGIFIRPSSDGTYYGMVMSVRPFSALFSYMLWHNELKFCTWLCFNVLQIKFECRHFASIFEGVMPLCEAKEKYRGMFEIQKSGDKTSSGEIGLDIRTHASPNVGQDQVSGGVSVLCWHAAPVAYVLWKPCTIR